MMGVTPLEACVCLTRMPPDDLDRMLQAPLEAVTAAWFRLAAVMATLEEQARAPEQQEQHHQGGLQEYVEDGYAGRGVVDEAARGTNGAGGDVGWRGGGDSGQRRQQLLLPGQLAIPPPRPPPSAVPQPDAKTRRMVLLCPRLLMLRPSAVRASALHLRSLLGLSVPRLRRLLARSPQLLLLPPRHRVDALDALYRQLRMRHPRDAARHVAQQPSLLKFTPEALSTKLEEMRAALRMSPAGVAWLCRNQPILLGMSAGSLEEKLRCLEALLALPDAGAARRLVLAQPAVLSMSSETAERKLHQLAAWVSLGTGPDAALRADTKRSAPRRARLFHGGGESAAPVGATGRRCVDASEDSGEAGDAGLAEARRLAAAEPTLLTMDMAALPRRLAALEEELGAASLAEARAAVQSCPRLLVVQRPALRHGLHELAWGLRAALGSVKALVRARPEVLFARMEELEGAVSRAEVAGAGNGLRGRERMAAVLEYVAREPSWDWLGGDENALP